ncbi:proton-conducting transporter transmembrane domain-containing protein [Gimesia aquarii]|uniref:NADH:quinone oxidoreductase/Mrp antiporter transmembrane domain-containing protein n=1 Tax=Gimesia aquarii TaxID=2527964 RepID=A0A517VNR9_9PLAN|nr:proton-conducting transporter membrane subunit [Gimesia aquarii]QDT94658.1 hypothetical protein V144x_00890 [Gimesia aquarii]
MFNNLFFLAISFELSLYLITLFALSRIQVESREETVLLRFKSSLPMSAILFSGVILLSASIGSTNLSVIHESLQRMGQESDLSLNLSAPALGIFLIMTGAAFRMGTVPTNFCVRFIQKEMPYWVSILSALAFICLGLIFLVLFVNKITVISFVDAEQILSLLALIVLTTTAGLLLIEKELKAILVLFMMQFTGVFLAQLSSTCWKWRHDSSEFEASSILDAIKEFFPELLLSYLAILGLACLLDSLSDRQSEVNYPNQIQGLIGDQRFLGSAAIFLLAILIGFPGLSVFRMRWQTLISLFEIHQESPVGMIPTVHLGYLGLGTVIVISSMIVSFVCAKLMIQICFVKPLARYRQIAHKGMALICFCSVISLLILNLRMIVKF